MLSKKWNLEPFGIASIFLLLFSAFLEFAPFFVGVLYSKKIGCDIFSSAILLLALSSKALESPLLNASDAPSISFLQVFGSFFQKTGLSYSILPALFSVLFLEFLNRKERGSSSDFEVVKMLLIIIFAFAFSFLVINPALRFIIYFLSNIIFLTMFLHPALFTSVAGLFFPFLVTLAPLEAHELLSSYFSAFGLPDYLTIALKINYASLAGVCLGTALISTDSRHKKLSLLCFLSSFMGFTQAAVFGVIIKSPKSIFFVIFAATISGSLLGFLYGKLPDYLPSLIAFFISLIFFLIRNRKTHIKN